MRIGVIGTGSMGRNHLRVVSGIEELKLAALADLNTEIFAELSERYGCPAYANYRQMLGQVDAVMVSVPTEKHYEIASYFLRHGVHVLVEKPIAMTCEEADNLIALAAKKGCVLAVGHLERFNPAVEYADRLISNPRFIEVQRQGPFSHRSLDIDVIMDLMIHDLDIILAWDRQGIAQIHASGIPLISNKIDIASVRLEFNSGLVANVTASRVSQVKTRKLRVFQKNQYLSVDYGKRQVKRTYLQGMEIVEEIPAIEDVEPLRNMWNHFRKAILGEPHRIVSGEDARNALALAHQIVGAIKKVE
jgi:predicted dehydrogenase